MSEIFSTMTTNKTTSQTFGQLFYSLFAQQYDLRTVFSDFVTMCICTLAMKPGTMHSYYEEDYLKAIQPYREKGLAMQFPILYAKLITEMELRVKSSQGNDVLGEFMEMHLLSKSKSQFFTPWPVCELIAKINCVNIGYEETFEHKRIIDPACGSGRLLVAGSRELHKYNHYYGIDIDLLCVKVTTINLFLNGIFHGEILCANALDPKNSFVESYGLSFLPFRLFKITKPEESSLWRSLTTQPSIVSKKDEDTELINKIINNGNGGQLTFF